jgi:Protein implicated in ribosomal biogenesis, Nop56p homolog
MPLYWFEGIQREGADRISGDLTDWADGLIARWDLEEPLIPLDWAKILDGEWVPSRRMYLSTLRDLCLALGEQRVASALCEGDEPILAMVRTLDELNGMINQLTERLVEWYSTLDPQFTRKESFMNENLLLSHMKERAEGVFLSCVVEGQRLLSLRNTLSREVSHLSEARYPNSSALVGGLVAVRLVARAGGLSRLARMSSSTLQVLGAESALFSHLHAGTLPPKHGIIYQHRRIHAAPRHLRGKVARVIAARLALAVRLDYYRGKQDPEFLRESQSRIERAGRRA